MKKMRKQLSLITAAILVVMVALAGCGTGRGREANAPDPTKAPAAETPAAEDPGTEAPSTETPDAGFAAKRLSACPKGRQTDCSAVRSLNFLPSFSPFVAAATVFLALL